MLATSRITGKSSFKISAQDPMFCFFTSDDDIVIFSEFIKKVWYSIHFLGAKADFSG